MAKDVVTFLSWAAEPEHDERKKYGIKAVIIFSTLFAISLYVKRFKWGPIKNRKISMDSLHSSMEKPINMQSLQSITLLLIKSIRMFVYFRVDENGGLKMLLNTTSNTTSFAISNTFTTFVGIFEITYLPNVLHLTKTEVGAEFD